MSIWKYLLTGLKVLLLDIIAGAIWWAISALIAVMGIVGGITGVFSSSSIPLKILSVVLMLIGLFLALFINGWMAQKLFRWK